MATTVDDRTDSQRATHRYLVIGTDRFMSGWGGAEGGLSYAAWACRPAVARECIEWVERRGDMSRVRTYLEGRRYRPGSSCAHLHIYVWESDRPDAIGKGHTMIRVYAEHAHKNERKFYRLTVTPEWCARHDNGALISCGLTIPDDMSVRSLQALIRRGRAVQVTQTEWKHSSCLSSCTERGDSSCRW